MRVSSNELFSTLKNWTEDLQLIHAPALAVITALTTNITRQLKSVASCLLEQQVDSFIEVRSCHVQTTDWGTCVVVVAICHFQVHVVHVALHDKGGRLISSPGLSWTLTCSQTTFSSKRPNLSVMKSTFVTVVPWIHQNSKSSQPNKVGVRLSIPSQDTEDVPAER